MFGRDVKIRLIHEEEFGNICVGSLIMLPSKLVLSLLYQFEELVLKSPIAVNWKGLFCAKSSNVISKLSAKVSESS